MTYEVTLYHETWCGESPYLTHSYKTKAMAMAIVKRIRAAYKRKGRKRVYRRVTTSCGTDLTEAWAISHDADENFYIEMNPKKAMRL